MSQSPFQREVEFKADTTQDMICVVLCSSSVLKEYVVTHGLEAIPSPMFVVFDENKEPIPVQFLVPHLRANCELQKKLEVRWERMINSFLAQNEPISELPILCIEIGRVKQLEQHFNRSEWEKLYDLDECLNLALKSRNNSTSH